MTQPPVQALDPITGRTSVVRAALANYWATVVVPNPDKVSIGDETFGALNPSRDDFMIFVEEMEILTRQARNPYIADIIARGAGFVWDAVRLTNEQTTGGYKGATSRGTPLAVNPFTLRDTGSAGGYPGTNPLSTWTIVRTVTGAARLFPAANNVDMLISSLSVMSHVILGWVNTVPVPKTQSVQLQQTDPWMEEFFNWTWQKESGEQVVNVYENKQPWITRPGNSYRVNVRYDRTGQDELQPIGFTVMRGQDIGVTQLAS